MSAVPSLMTSQHEAIDLVSRARDGDPEALTELYRTWSRDLMALAYRLTGSRADAEDVLHDVFLGLPEALRRYEERGSLGSWLRRVTARVALTRLRSRRRAREVPLDPVLRSSHQSDRVGDLAAVQRAVSALPDSLRVVFTLREIEGYSHGEIAELLGISANASEVRLHRAIRALRKVLAPENNS